MHEAPRFARRFMTAVWPAFLMAGVLEMLVFAVVDPTTLHWFGSTPIDWPAPAVYTVAFFIFWAVIATSAALTQLLDLGSEEINLPRERGHNPWPR